MTGSGVCLCMLYSSMRLMPLAGDSSDAMDGCMSGRSLAGCAFGDRGEGPRCELRMSLSRPSLLLYASERPVEGDPPEAEDVRRCADAVARPGAGLLLGALARWLGFFRRAAAARALNCEDLVGTAVLVRVGGVMLPVLLFLLMLPFESRRDLRCIGLHKGKLEPWMWLYMQNVMRMGAACSNHHVLHDDAMQLQIIAACLRSQCSCSASSLPKTVDKPPCWLSKGHWIHNDSRYALALD